MIHLGARRAVVMAVGCVVLLAGCGSSSSSTSPSLSTTVAATTSQSSSAAARASTKSPPVPGPTPNSSTITQSKTGTNALAQTTSTSANSPTPTTSTITPGAIATANTICLRRSHELASARIVGVGDLPALADAARRRAAIERRALGELEKLTPPTDVAASYRKLIASDRAALREVVKLRVRAQAGDTAGVRLAKAKVEGGGLRLLLTANSARLKYCAAVG
jgi:hypothetical protein